MSKTPGYKLKKVAQTVAERMKIELKEYPCNDKNLLEILEHYPNLTDYLAHFTVQRGEVNKEIILRGQRNDEAKIFYRGGISEDTGKTIEAVYVEDSKRMLTITWGFPEDLGVLEVFDLESSIVLQELSGVTKGMHGGEVVTHVDAPKPQPYKGIANFEEQDFGKLYRAIDTLLG